MAASTSSGSRLLDMPPELRSHIYRMAIIHNQPIVVSTQGYNIPPLLSVCKQIRHEAESIFYYENTFETELFDYNIELHHKIMRHLKYLGLQKKKIDASPKSMSRMPHWPNIMHWLELYHRCDIDDHFTAIPDAQAAGRHPYPVTIGALFEIVDTASSLLPWVLVKLLVLPLRAVLISIDPK
ncbi:hypothetical protein LTR56_019552 [Elasticomyces elasticus]|nr:hypothetical protein LTR56_019552 [Elasticomyces elasticus]KAK3653762.1 hypothetical protein LTR22_011141 [Elasticomyces elasticus]KAK4924129.1 hypothetical protein LTR49_008648 [Elasticomyces elasticus]KAK5758477.1 hypothetical protein LTS12_011339 [Elasticomyces elasticus]